MRSEGDDLVGVDGPLRQLGQGANLDPGDQRRLGDASGQRAGAAETNLHPALDQRFEHLLQAATSGNPRIFLGTDSAPHAAHLKENACGCAGMFSAITAIELYAEVFEKAGALDKLEAFASQNGARFYGLPQNSKTITLKKESQRVPESVPFGEGAELVPMRAGG